MEFDEKSAQLEEISIDKVCRTCLTTSEELMVSLYDEDEMEKINYLDMITTSFGKIVPSLQNLPVKLCCECQDLIRKSYEFKSRCMKSTEILIGSYEQSKILLADSKETQTEHVIPFDDDENFDGIQLQSEDIIFEAAQENPLINIQQNIANEEIEALDENFVIEEQPLLIEVEPKEETLELNVSDELKCDKCSKTFSRMNHLKRHMLTHEDVKPLKCTTCDKRFTRPDHLNHHILSSHSESKPFHCEVEECKKGFIKKEQLKKHMDTKHSGNNTTEICEICQKTFKSKKYLRSHMRVHVGDKINIKKDLSHERPYLCSECGLRFVRNDYLVIHMRRHLGLKPYKCKFCDKGFPRATDLTVHERYHTNEKTHLCNLCGKGFQRAYNLLVHMRVHTGEKPYQCSYCNKSFSQGNDLKAHVRRHTGERFKCDLCNEGFIQGYHLTHHKRTVHGLDVKSHIRRVEKFAAPMTAAEIEKHEQEPPTILNIEPIKMENEYQVIMQ